MVFYFCEGSLRAPSSFLNEPCFMFATTAPVTDCSKYYRCFRMCVFCSIGEHGQLVAQHTRFNFETTVIRGNPRINITHSLKPRNKAVRH